jgi:AcrR family transcriptional regulator
MRNLAFSPVQQVLKRTATKDGAMAGTGPVLGADLDQADGTVGHGAGQQSDSPRADSLRADAQHNRDRILEAARESFGASGEASLNSIAKKAGVGPGTLYRHFPSREALVLAVYRYDVQALADSAAGLLSEHEPLRALRLWFDRLAYYGQIKRGLADVLHTATSDGLAGETYGPVVGAITLLLTACTGDGSIRPGIEPDDVLLLLGFLWRIDPGGDADARAARLLDLIVAGLKADGPAPGHLRARPRRRPSRPRPRQPGRVSLLSRIRPRTQ